MQEPGHLFRGSSLSSYLPSVQPIIYLVIDIDPESRPVPMSDFVTVSLSHLPRPQFCHLERWMYTAWDSKISTRSLHRRLSCLRGTAVSRLLLCGPGLNQPLPLERSSAKHWRRMQVSAQLSQAGINCSEMISVNSKNHYLPGCVCSKLHSRCEGAAQPLGSDSSDSSESTNCRIPLEDLCNVAKTGCWFCSILYGGVKACPVWDAGRSKRATFQSSVGIFVSGGGGEGRGK